MDNTGKNTIIGKLLEKYPVIRLIHCGKPKSSDSKSAQKEQEELFKSYADLNVKEFIIGDTDAFIYNRSWYGEYVYGCMYRNADENRVLETILTIESFLKEYTNNIYLITLVVDNPDFLVKNDDGKSLSDTKISNIETEKQRFETIHNFSNLPKKLITVNNGKYFKPIDDIMTEIYDLIGE